MRTERVLGVAAVAAVALLALGVAGAPGGADAQETAAREFVGGIERAAPAPAVPAAGAREIVVGPGGAVATVAEALAAARDGDVIRIRSGTYSEGPLKIERSVTLVGDGWPVLDGQGEDGVLFVEADHVTVRGLVLRGAGRSHVRDNAALRVGQVRGCVVENNRLEENFFGVYLAKSQDCRVAGNVIESSGTRESTSGNGIHLWNAVGTRIENNEVRGHRDGIYLEHARRTDIAGNRSLENLRYGLHFMFSDSSTYTGNSFLRNGAGVAVMYSRHIHMTGNLFQDNWGSAAYGLLLKDIGDAVVSGNRFIRNTVALHSDGSQRVEVTGNDFRRNGWAARVMASSRGNTFSGNNFVDNSFDVSTNSRHNFNTFDGNHWSRYAGYDLAGDGIGDVPHRPVRLFAVIVERQPTAMVLLRSVFVDLLDVAERVFPVLTPEALMDENPRIREIST